MTIIDHRDGVPVYELKNAGQLIITLMCEPLDIELPCWVRCGRGAHRITRDDAKGVLRGLMIAAEMEEKP